MSNIEPSQQYLLCRFFLFWGFQAVSWDINLSSVPIYDLCIHIVSCRHLQSVSYVASILWASLFCEIRSSPYRELYLSAYREHICKLWAVNVYSCARAVGNEIDFSISNMLSTDSCILEHQQLNYERLQFVDCVRYYIIKCECLKAMICLHILWTVSVWVVWAIGVSILYYECPQVVRVSRLWTLSVSILWPVYFSTIRTTN